MSILFVSPDGDLRVVACRVLRRAGWDVTAVRHSGLALLACARGRRFDVVVVDEREGSGELTADALARQLRRDCPDIQAVSLRDQRADELIDAVRSAVAASPA